LKLAVNKYKEGTTTENIIYFHGQLTPSRFLNTWGPVVKQK